MVEDIDLPLSTDYLDFSSDVMDSLSSPKYNPFAVRHGWQQDSYSSQGNSSFGHCNEDKWSGKQVYVFFSHMLTFLAS